MASDYLTSRFADLSRDRDTRDESSTEARGYMSAEGFVHEVTSTSPSRLCAASGEVVQCVTRRTTVTTLGESELVTAPRLKYGGSQKDSFRNSPGGFSSSQSHASHSGAFPSGYRGQVDASPQAVRPPSQNKEWVSSVAQYPPRSISQSSSRRSVTIGGADTRVIEPSRMSPIHVQGGYAPVKFVTRAELQRLREQRSEWGRDVGRMVRCSSVPRLDEAEPMSFHAGREFAPHEDGHYPSPGRPMHAHGYAPVPMEDDLESIASSAGGDHRRRLQRERPGSGYGVPPDAASMYSSQIRHNTFGVSSEPRGVQQPYHRSASGPVVRPNDLGQGGASVSVLAEHVAALRGVQCPVPPKLAEAAFPLLNRGTYLVKYGRQGSPHERFLAIRMVPDEISGRPQPCLVWAVHADAATFKEKMNLAFLTSAVAGAGSASFLRLMVTNSSIEGPRVGQSKQVLPTTFAFSLVFESTHVVRTVDLLALDEQTFRCWMITMSYFASIGSSGSAPMDVGGLAPDTPRSQSQASHTQ